MRELIQPQTTIDYNPSSLKITKEYYAKHEAISWVLDENPQIPNYVHRDLAKALREQPRSARYGRPCTYTSDTVLRILICRIIEGEPLRGIVVRIDDSHFLRRFVRIDEEPMMDYTTLCRLRNTIRPESWHRINRALTRSAFEAGAIEEDALRLDTTALETNIHWPTDSSLLWDCTSRTIKSLPGVLSNQGWAARPWRHIRSSLVYIRICWQRTRASTAVWTA